VFLLVPAYPGCPRSKAVKRSLLLLLLHTFTLHFSLKCGVKTCSFNCALFYGIFMTDFMYVLVHANEM